MSDYRGVRLARLHCRITEVSDWQGFTVGLQRCQIGEASLSDYRGVRLARLHCRITEVSDWRGFTVGLQRCQIGEASLYYYKGLQMWLIFVRGNDTRHAHTLSKYIPRRKDKILSEVLAIRTDSCTVLYV